jgi:Protein of unknown function (DUF4254)
VSGAPLAAAALLAFHDGGGGAPAGALWEAIADNHRHNRLLWDEEDLARRRHVPDSEIANNKRAIDGFNQKRNDAIERIDENLISYFSGVKRREASRLNSETPGSMIDRLSILSLKIHHMRLQTQRTDVDRSHVEDCARKLSRLNEQRADLAACLDRLLAECASGAAHFKIYRQFKMYNDPALNPALYGEKK